MESLITTIKLLLLRKPSILIRAVLEILSITKMLITITLITANNKLTSMMMAKKMKMEE
jgi:hypothetical protein